MTFYLDSSSFLWAAPVQSRTYDIRGTLGGVKIKTYLCRLAWTYVLDSVSWSNENPKKAAMLTGFVFLEALVRLFPYGTAVFHQSVEALLLPFAGFHFGQVSSICQELQDCITFQAWIHTHTHTHIKTALKSNTICISTICVSNIAILCYSIVGVTPLEKQ